MRRIALIGAPINMGQPHPGVSQGPRALRGQGIKRRLYEPMKQYVVDRGNLAVSIQHGYNNSVMAVGNACQQVAEKVYEEIEDGSIPVVMGGDHSVAIGTIAATLRAFSNAGVIWVDAHADINTPSTSPSGNLHGMPVAILAGKARDAANKPLPGHEWLSTFAPPLDISKNLVYIGLRDVDSGEREMLDRHNVCHYGMSDIESMGIEEVTRRALSHLGPHQRPIHLSFDIDACDPREAPATGTPVSGGLSRKEALHIARAVSDTKALVAMDMVEINPSIAAGSRTAQLGVDIIACATSVGDSTQTCRPQTTSEDI